MLHASTTVLPDIARSTRDLASKYDDDPQRQGVAGGLRLGADAIEELAARRLEVERLRGGASMTADLARVLAEREILRRELEQAREKLRIAEAVRDDARAAAQRYLDAKREAERQLSEVRDDLIRQRLARIPEMTEQEIERQRESFAVGNVAVDRDLSDNPNRA